MKTYRGNMQSVDPQDALLPGCILQKVYEAFLCDLLKVTSRPTSKMLCDATAKVWLEQSPLEQKTFNNHVKVLFGKASTGQRHQGHYFRSKCRKRQLAVMDDFGDSPKPVLPA